MFRQVKSVALLLVAAAACGCNSGSQPSPPEESSNHTPVTGSADDVIQDFSEFYHNAGSFRVNSQVRAELQISFGDLPPGYEPMEFSREFLIAAPDRLAFKDDEGAVIRSDGEHLYAVTPDGKRYWRGEAPRQIAALLDHQISNLFRGPGMMRPLILAGDEPVDALDSQVGDLEYVDKEQIDGVSAHHLRVTPADSEGESNTGVEQIDVWIAAEGDPVLLRHRFENSPKRTQVGPNEFINASMIITETFSEWEFDPADVDEAVAFVPDDDALRFAGLGGAFGETNPMVGKPAPKTVLEVVDGETRTLADHEGDIVILDFWATWCGPCREELPLLARLADEFQNDGVVLYAVNQQEDVEDIQQFLTQENLDITATLDPKGEIARDYGVGGIPHVAIVGRNGVIQAVHVGVNRDLSETEREFREELQALISGRNIAKEGLPH
ncbi:MAG: DUF2092 domain-containing protein [Planctomycetota bacterium]|nr:MAG: DUF2092 domain-containing protein [Planctomycetota bacterium]REJ89875.1 MAG: DUF2092 domain-containing protein [Planctomycetota bacterium]REK29799.1 MAG: DUF2092 domain-containing protein [Planctomycetota bacterium]REK30381.1 MAG: DUF2092 domain-containing protein [Planctomycetota bacterium]